MSLDVYLTSDPEESSCTCTCTCGHVHKTSKESIVFSSNITHNLAGMARLAEIYIPVWRPEEAGITKAHQLIPILAKGLVELDANPDKFKKLNPSNGWGTYEDLVSWLEGYLEACTKYPNASVEASR